jgi:ribonuclease HI
MLYFDGSLMAMSVRVGVVLVSPRGDGLTYAIRLEFHASNNLVEYEALVHGLRIASKLGEGREDS